MRILVALWVLAAYAQSPNILGRVDVQKGESRRNENIFITALDNNTQKESNIRLGTTATAITEFNAATRYYGAEFGLAPSGGLHLTPARAAKAIHGNLQWTHANAAVAARSFFQVGGVLPARQNILAGRLTAPLWKNAVLGLDGAEDNRSGYVNGNILVPLASERSCLATEAAACAIINRFLRAWPALEPNRTDIAARFLNTNAAQALKTTSTTARLDQVLGKHRLAARHTWTHQDIDAFQLVAGQNPDTTTKSHDARLTWTYTRSARTVLDATAAFSRNRTLLVPEPNAVGPQVLIGTAFEKLGPGSSIPLDRIQNRFRYTLRLQQRFSRHTLSAGGEFARLRFNGREASSNRGNLYFRNDFGRDAITNFRLGAVSRYSFSVGSLDRGFRRNEPTLFVQDVWRPRGQLTIHFGLRYQPQTGVREVDNLTPIPFRCDCDNLAPNLGLAWRRIRVAYSTQFGEILPATLQQLRWNPPGFQKIENQAPPLLNLLEGITLNPNARAIVFNVPSNLQTPYSHQFNLSVALPLPAVLGKLEAAYIGSRTWKLLYMLYLNRAEPVPGVPQTTATINDRRRDPRYFDYRVLTNSPRAYFDAGKLTHTLNTKGGLSAETSYWYSKAIDTGATYVNIAAGDDAMQGQSQTPFNIAADLKGVSDFDQTHALLTRLSYELPGRQRLLRRWRVSSIFVAKSGIPFKVITGADSPGFGNVDGSTGDRPNLLTPSILGRTISHPDLAAALLPRTAFAYPNPTDPRGNLGNNVFRRAAYRNLNASVERRFTLPHERALSFRAEAINTLNTPQFAEPVGDLSNPAFGKIVNTLNDGRTFRFSLSLDF
ncbi:MAG: hypothetical protein K7J47_12425 [Acidobacteria bacterium]|jgi:hypothetical protein|nr:hypothetical protein [Bryobacteraceae bacterium CoA2 C42]